MINYDDAVGRPKAVLTEIVEFLGDLGMAVDGDLAQAIDFIEELAPDRNLTRPSCRRSTLVTARWTVSSLSSMGGGGRTADRGVRVPTRIGGGHRRVL